MVKTTTGIISWLRGWFDDIYALKSEIPSGNSSFDIDDVYPVGYIFMTADPYFSPASEFGGTWERIKGRFLIGADDTSKYPCESTGGYESVTLTANQSGIRAHNHGMSHTHSHNHVSSAYESGKASSGSAQPVPRGRTNSSKTGTFETDTDATASSKSSTDNNTASNATEAHTNIPPYFAVNIWRRIA